MSVIELKNITKKYAENVGCFDINITINEGEIYGFIGPNGAGKTTLIRQMAGFIKSDQGTGTILGHDMWKEAQTIMTNVGYLSGEVILPDYMTGLQYLKLIAAIRKNVDWSYTEKLIAYFDFDPKRKIKKMSKGMKQKIAIINAFMHKPKLLILDEPTSGLDPLMQQKFTTLVMNCKKEKATVFMSSHIFGEIENTCDKVAIIKNGKIITEVVIDELKRNYQKTYELKFSQATEYHKFINTKKWTMANHDDTENIITVFVANNDVNDFLKTIANYKVDYLREIPFNLEKYFIKYYEKEINFDD